MYRYNFDMYIGCSILFSGFWFLCTMVYLYFNRQFKEVFATFVYTLFASSIIFLVSSPVLFFTIMELAAGVKGSTFINMLFGLTLSYFLIVFTVMGYYLNKHSECTAWIPRIIFALFLASWWYIIPFAPILALVY